MPPQIDPLSLWAILRIKDSLFAVPCDSVQSIIALTGYTPVPDLPKDIRGIIRYQEQPISLIDLRSRLGISSLSVEVDEFVELMNAREQDHVNWLNTLQECINEKKKFTLATDPKKCKFGQWYYRILPETKDVLLKSILELFEKPHSEIHHIAIQAERLIDQGKTQEATQLIDNKRNHELRKMINLFNEVKTVYRSHHQEIAVILKYNDRLFSLIVDEVVNISNLSWDHWQSIEDVWIGDKNLDFISGMAETLEENSPVAILDLARLSG